MTNEELYQLCLDNGQGMKALKTVYEKGRSESIDEFYEKCREEYWYSSNFMNFFNKVREQLKEQKNN